MTIEHIQGIFSPEHGGPMVSLRNFAVGQAESGLKVKLRVLEGFRNTSPALRITGAVEQEVFPVAFPQVAGRSPMLRRFLRSSTSPDIYHLHGVWLLAQKYGMREARRRGVPYILEMMGGYQPQELRRKPWRKLAFRRWFQDELLRGAACIHTNSSLEAAQLRELGFDGPFAPIPVGFDVPTADRIEAGLRDWRPEFARDWRLGDRIILYVARVHPNKGIGILLDAFREIANELNNVRLVVAGPGDPEYMKVIQAKVAADLKVGSVQLLGFVTEREKVWLYRNSTIYCLPSFSENYAATVQDALGYGTPVLTTWETPWHELETKGVGWLSRPDRDEIYKRLRQALDTPPDVWAKMGECARAWIRRDFSLSRVIEMQIELYRWLLGERRPSFVVG